MDQQEEKSLVRADEAIEGEFREQSGGEADSLASDLKQPVKELARSHGPDRWKVRAMRRFLKAYRRSGQIGIALREAGLNNPRLYAWRREYPWFDRMIDEAFEQNIAQVEDTAFEMAISGNEQVMTRWYLERSKPERWGKPQEKGNGPPLTIHIEQTVYDAI